MDSDNHSPSAPHGEVALAREEFTADGENEDGNSHILSGRRGNNTRRVH